MKLKTLFVVTTIVALLFGLAFVFIPTEVYSWYGVESNAILNYMGQLFGASLLGIAFISWRVRNAADSDARQAIVFAFFAADGIGFIVALIGQLNNVINSVGWTTVVIYFLLSLGFLIFLFKKAD